MQNSNIKKFMIFFGLILSFTIQRHAFAGNETHGGDICENRFQTVRDDISKWILNGGSEGLRFPEGVTLEQYNQKVLAVLKKAKMSCTEDTLYIGSAEKTCKNWISQDGSDVILCNVRRFMDTSHADQYTLVHHEYAGLAGYEINNGENSNYFLSNQLIGFLENEVDQRLVITRTSAGEDNAPIGSWNRVTGTCLGSGAAIPCWRKSTVSKYQNVKNEQGEDIVRQWVQVEIQKGVDTPSNFTFESFALNYSTANKRFLENLISYSCSSLKGVKERIMVAAGTFDTCRVKEFDKVTWIAAVPGGVAKQRQDLVFDVELTEYSW